MSIVVRKLERRLLWSSVFITLLSAASEANSDTPSSATRDDFWLPDGPVHAIVENKGVIYIGGKFDYISPVFETGRAFDPVSGLALPEFPLFAGAIKAIVNDGAGGWFVGGNFISVGGWPITNLARIKADISVDTNCTPNPNNAVLALATDGTRLFVGGTFTRIGGMTRPNLAALDLNTGAVRMEWQRTEFTALGSPRVNAVVVSGGRLYAGGDFLTINHSNRAMLASLDAATGVVDAWTPNGSVGGNATAQVTALAVAGDVLYVSGSFRSFGGNVTNGPTRNRLAAVDVNKDYTVLDWNPDADDTVSAIAVSCDTVYIGGSFKQIGGEARAHIAALETAVGTNSGRAKQSWNPGVNNDIISLMLAGNVLYAGGKFSEAGGQPRSFLAAFDADAGKVTTWNPKADAGVAGIALSGGVLISGGALGPEGKLRRNVAALDVRTGRPLDWSPQIGGGTEINAASEDAVYALAVSGNKVYLGGAFTTVDGQARNRLAAVNARTGELKRWNPNVNSIVEALAAFGHTVYIGGSFSTIRGRSRTNIAAVTATTGGLRGWKPAADNKVTAIARRGSTIFIGGLFTEVNRKQRNHLAALDAVTGAALPWNVQVNDEVSSLSVAGDRLYFGGLFDMGAGSAEIGKHRFTCWDPDPRPPAGANQRASVSAVLALRDVVYIGGSFQRIAGAPRRSLAAVSVTCPPTNFPWNPDVDNSVNALALTNGTLYAGGLFQRVGGSYRPHFAVFPPVGSPSITLQPQRQTISVGESVVLEAAAVGEGVLSYQWQFNDMNIPGANQPTLRIDHAQVTDSGDYVLVVTNKLGLIHSRAATVTVIEPLEIVSHPQNQNVAPGATVMLSVEATGYPSPAFQWRLNAMDIPGAIESTFTITNAQPTNGGAYSVVIANIAETIESDIAFVNVNAPLLPFTDNLNSHVTLNSPSGVGSGSNIGATREPGETNHVGKVGGSSVWLGWKAPATGIATFSTRGSAFDTLLAVYTGNDIANLNPVVADEDDGGFLTSEVSFAAKAGTEYFIVVDGFAGASGDVVLSWSLDTTTAEFPRIFNQPDSITVTTGATAIFHVDVDSPSPVQFQWFFDCEATAGATNDTLEIANVTLANVGSYRVFVENAQRRVAASFAANLDIGPDPKVQSEDKLEDILNADAESTPAKAAKLQAGGSLRVGIGSINSQVLNNLRATKSLGESNHCGVAGGKSKWLGLRATNDGVMEVNTIGSTIDTVLAVYTANGFSLRWITCDNDGAPDGVRSLVRFPAISNIAYLVVADAPRRAGGRIKMNWKFDVPPVIGASSPPQFVMAGETVTLFVTATSAIPPLTFQWRVNGTNLSGAMTSTNGSNVYQSVLTLTNFQSAQNGFYDVVVSNFAGAVTNTIGLVEVASLSPIAVVLVSTNQMTCLRLSSPLTTGCVIETSADLVQWHPVWTNRGPASLDFMDPEPATATARFYRIRPHR